MNKAAHHSPTLADVARQAGVSTATVSRCLNEPDRVAQATRQHVLAAIESLGYSPNFGAQALAARRTNTVGAIIPTMENAIFARGLQAFQDELNQNGITLLVSSSSYSAEREDEQVRTLVRRGAEGLLLIGLARAPGLYDFLAQHRVPAVAAWAYDPQAAIPTVGFDNRAAMRSMAEQALALGHHRVAMISAKQSGNDRARQRVEGVREALTNAGLNPADLALVETSYGIDEGKAAFAKLMADAQPTVVFCGNDVLAVGAMSAARAAGLSVPGDVSITGFDDIELAKVTSPALATVHVPHRRMGGEAARALLRTLSEGSEATDSVLLETELKLRGSLTSPA
ncbi:MAG TPA: LacI family transcriptional regulator [Gammaproteobacteria bacterium]|jgi:LacI family transcriptional regulator|nr:LacI family transcriptional regulator [Gammaproteobacteria bacterium]